MCPPRTCPPPARIPAHGCPGHPKQSRGRKGDHVYRWLIRPSSPRLLKRAAKTNIAPWPNVTTFSRPPAGIILSEAISLYRGAKAIRQASTDIIRSTTSSTLATRLPACIKSGHRPRFAKSSLGYIRNIRVFISRGTLAGIGDTRAL
jgi:hypothetical protein